ncbi:molybdopterin-dependent oxidoreductase [Shigella flexneri]
MALKAVLGVTRLNGRRLKPEEVEWQTAAIEGKLDLLVTLDFRMSSTCLFSDIVLPTATWLKKQLNCLGHASVFSSLSAAVDPAWESRSDWEIYKGIAKVFSEVCIGHLGTETDVVSSRLQHDSPGNCRSRLIFWTGAKANAI